jgi:nucleoside-diphosphate-sugar epimerase
MQNITLIGKGLVAKHLLNQFGERVVAQYDSKNIHTLPEREHEIVFCAAPSAKKWIANSDPVTDSKSCNILIENLRKARLEKVILFSTVDVYPDDLASLDEDSHEYSSHAYGVNRRAIETSLSLSVPCSIVRLPALFGSHLEKNYVFDLMNDNNLSAVRTNTAFQWLDLRRIRECVAAAERYGLVNYVVEPISTLEIVSRFFPAKLESIDSSTLGSFYDIKSKHTASGYFHDKEQVLRDMEEFFNDRDHNSGNRQKS